MRFKSWLAAVGSYWMLSVLAMAGLVFGYATFGDVPDVYTALSELYAKRLVVSPLTVPVAIFFIRRAYVKNRYNNFKEGFMAATGALLAIVLYVLLVVLSGTTMDV